MIAQMRNESYKLIGYVAFQVPINKINNIMLRRDGMGRTGETYLVGQDGLMRCDSYLDKEGRSVVASFKNNIKVDTKENENDAVKALIVLGFSQLEAKHRVKKILNECNDMTLEEIICHSLR